MKGMIALDVGTTAVKAAIITEDLNIIGLSIKEYTLSAPSPEIVELDSRMYWDNAVEAVKELLAQTKFPPGNIISITCTTQGETFIPVDKNGDALFNAVVWLDSRANDEGNFIAEKFPKEAFYAKTGIPELNGYTPIAKLLWFKNNKADIYNKTHKFLLVEDFLIARLSGVYISNPSIMCSTGYFDIVNLQIWNEILDYCGIDRQKIPDIAPCGSIVGTLSENAAASLGLPAGISITTGAMDQVAAAIGSSSVEEGIVVETTGTALVVTTSIKHPDIKNWKPVCVYTHGIQGKYLNVLVIQTAGMLYKWFRDTFCSDLQGNRFEEMNKLAAADPPGCRGLLIYPHFTGTQFPLTNNKIRGSFIGVGLDSTRGSFLRAIMESIACTLRECIEFINVRPDEIRSLGGGSKSSLWNQIKADVTGTAISTMNIEEASLLGAAILGGCAKGIYLSPEAACANLEKNNLFQPNMENKAVYDAVYQRYKQLYPALEVLF